MNIKNSKFLISGHDISSETVSRQGEGICSKAPILGKSRSRAGTGAQDRFWTCSQTAFLKPEQLHPEKEYKEANYVHFRIHSKSSSTGTLHIIEINDKYCNPPEKQCNRDNLLDKTLTELEGLPFETQLEDIHFDYSKDTCQSILVAAEKAGFKYAALINPQVKGECAKIKEVDSDSKEIESTPTVLCKGFFPTKCKAKRIALSKKKV